ncbi:hypothetical protein PQX77_008158, partial [Marasmius sp. AFHP31]
MSSEMRKGWQRKLRNGKTFADIPFVSPVTVSTVDFTQLVQPAMEREEGFWGEEGVEMTGESREEEEGIWLADDWTEQQTPGSSSSKVKLEAIPACSTPNKRKFSFEEQPARTRSPANARRAKRRRRDFEGPEAHISFNPPPVSEPIATAFASEALPSKADAYTAKTAAYCGEFKESAKVYTLQDLQDLGYQIIEWNGESSRPIMDAAGRIIAVMVGRPGDPSYVEDALRFHDYILECRPMFEGGDETQQRGAFPAQAVGISHGMGQAHPTRLQNAKYGDMVQKLLRTREADRIATFQS